MRAVSIVLGILAAAGSVAPSKADADLLDKGRPERTLECNSAQAGGCDVSCVSTSGTVLFVHGGVVRAYITEFAGSHTLLELQKGAAGEIVSVLVGDISHCSLNGLRDAALAQRSRE
jgi:hypothetical protein